MGANKEDFQAGTGVFYVAQMGRGRSERVHLVTGDTSTKCTKLGDVHEPDGPIPHPGGKLTAETVGPLVEANTYHSRYALCPKCFPKEGK